jgi:hypothetical protein
VVAYVRAAGSALGLIESIIAACQLMC